MQRVLPVYLFLFFGIFHDPSFAGCSHSSSLLASPLPPVLSRPDPFPGSTPFPSGKVIDSVICQQDPSQSYALYIPAIGNNKALPVIYFFDAHANGSLPLHKYQSLAEAFGFILIGSNNSKNGTDWSTTDNIAKTLFDDSQKRLLIAASRIYTCGFSGGAKVASHIALQNPRIKGVIANGAGLPDGVPAGQFPFSFTAIAGDGDMNLTELLRISKDLDNTGTAHRILIFEGKHEWAPASTMRTAFIGLQFDAMRAGTVPIDHALIRNYIQKSKTLLSAYSKTNHLLKANEECNLSLNLLSGLSPDARWFKDKAASLTASTSYQQQLKAQNELLLAEENTKVEYRNHLQLNDRPYWTSIINGLNAGSQGTTAESAMHRRLLAWLSLAFYSLSNQLLNRNSQSEARYFVDLYKSADPANSEAWYFSAILNARDGNVHATEADLLKAAGHGFIDKSRLWQQPEFKNPRAPINLARIAAAMHGTSTN